MILSKHATLTPENVRERSKYRLEHGRCQQKGGTAPECLDSRAFQRLCHDLEVVRTLVELTCLGLKLTGRATEIEVASRAAIKTMTQRLPKAAMNLHPGLKASGFSGLLSDAESGLAADAGASTLGSFGSDSSLRSNEDLDGVAIVYQSANRIQDTGQKACRRCLYCLYHNSSDRQAI